MVDLKGMSKKKKAEYIWEYYKLHIIGTLAVIAIIISLIHGQITKIDYVFNLTLLGNIVDSNKMTSLEKELTSVVVSDGDPKKQATVGNFSIDSTNGGGDPMAGQYMQKFIAQMSVGELDVVILDKDMYESFVKQDMFLKLDNISELDLASIKSEKLEASGSDNIKAVYAINASDIKKIKDIGFDTKNKVIGIIGSCKHIDNATLVLKWLLK